MSGVLLPQPQLQLPPQQQPLQQQQQDHHPAGLTETLSFFRFGLLIFNTKDLLFLYTPKGLYGHLRRSGIQKLIFYFRFKKRFFFGVKTDRQTSCYFVIRLNIRLCSFNI